MSSQFLSHLADHGIKQLVSCPHTPQQNGLSERKHRHITELGITMMYCSKVPQQLWVEAFFTATFLSNLLPLSVLADNKGSYEALHGSAPVYSSLRIFGCKCYPYLRPYMHDKLDPKSLVCVFLGYNEKYKGYRCYYPPTGKVYISRHVLFDETSYPCSDIYSKYHKNSDSPLLQAWRMVNISSPPLTRQPDVAMEELPPTIITAPIPATLPPQTIVEQGQSSSSSDGDLSEHEEVVQDEPPQPAHHSMKTRARAGIVKPNPRYALFTVKESYPVPKNLKAALNDHGWNGAMGFEIGNMVETETFELVPPSPEQKLINNGWIYKEKLNADGTHLKLRARLVAQGNEQEAGVDFIETFSPVVRTATIRTVLHVAVTKKWKIKQLDVQNAFLHGDLKETVYMAQPKGFEDPDKPDHVWKLKKAIYGLRQAPRAWFDKFSNFLIAFGFQCSFPAHLCLCIIMVRVSSTSFSMWMT